LLAFRRERFVHAEDTAMFGGLVTKRILNYVELCVEFYDQRYSTYLPI